MAQNTIDHILSPDNDYHPDNIPDPNEYNDKAIAFFISMWIGFYLLTWNGIKRTLENFNLWDRLSNSKKQGLWLICLILLPAVIIIWILNSSLKEKEKYFVQSINRPHP